MKLTKVLGAQALRFILVKTQIYRPDIVSTLRERYGFVRFPQTADEMLPPPGRPMTFGHGRFAKDDRAFIVDSLEIYGEVIVVKTTTNTNDADMVLDDLLTISPEQIGQGSADRAYISQLEIQFGVQLDHLWPIPGELQKFGSALTAIAQGYLPSQKLTPFRVVSYGLGVDPASVENPSEFRVERRAGAAFDSNVYFSQAPFRTEDHLRTLEEFERYLQAAARATALGAPTA